MIAPDDRILDELQRAQHTIGLERVIHRLSMAKRSDRENGQTG